MKKIIPFIISILFLSCADGQKPEVFKPSKTGPLSIGVAETIKSAKLSEDRTLNIYLPEGYNTSDTTRYGVIYLLDGGMDEDFLHIVGLIHFSSMPWVKRLPPSIVIGICNVDRKRDFTYPTTVKSDKDILPVSGGSEKFIAFIEQELQPYIQQRFRTNGSKMIIGQSLGGLLAAEILARKPQLFNSYVIVSPSLWWDDGSLLKARMTLSSTNPSAQTKVYVAVGKEGLAPSAAPHVMEIDANVFADKVKSTGNKNIQLYFDYLPDENHGTILHLAVSNAFKVFSKSEKMD